MDLTQTPEVEADSDAAMGWGKYALAAGLAGAAWTLGQKYIGGTVTNIFEELLGTASGGQAGNSQVDSF